MLMRSWPVLVGAIAVAGACAAQAPAPPVADLASPEAALRSYWALLDWRDAAQRARAVLDETEMTYQRRMIEMTAGRTRKFYQTVQAAVQEHRQTRLERKIVKTAQDSPERAVITANIRNVTPIPAGVKPPSPSAAQLREKGEDYRYVLVLEDGQWRVLEVWSLFVAPRLLYAPFTAEYPAYVPPQ
jgi:hypothetical protein